MKSYSQFISEAVSPKYAKPPKNALRTKATDARLVTLWIEGPKRKEKGTLWYVPSTDGPMVPWVLGYAAEKWGTAPWVVYKFRVETDRKGDGVRFIRHADCERNGFTHWKKFDPLPQATF